MLNLKSLFLNLFSKNERTQCPSAFFVYVNDAIWRILISFIFGMIGNTFGDLAAFSFYRAWIDYSFLNIYTIFPISIFILYGKKSIYSDTWSWLGVTGHLLWCVFQGFWGMNWMKLNVYFSTYIAWSIWWYFCHVATMAKTSKFCRKTI